MNAAAVVLAAGGSTRLGSPKQLLAYGGRSLLRRAAESARAAVDGPVLVILGSGAADLAHEVAGTGTQTLFNPDWGRGMGTGVRLAMDTLRTLAPAGIDALLLTLCDQPFVGPEALGRLLDVFRRAASPGALAAAAYGGTVGVPAVFGRAYFDELCALPDGAGAKAILLRHREAVVAVALPEAAVDIDTREQYAALITGNS